MFYFHTIYSDISDNDFWEIQEETLIDWHLNDLPDDTEINRTNTIESYQGNKNPYVVDPSLVGRAFLVSGSPLTGDINQDQAIDILDVVMYISHIIDQITLDDSLIIIGDINYDLTLDVLDVVLLVQIILQ